MMALTTALASASRSDRNIARRTNLENLGRLGQTI
jgi:hypothetical protein